MFFDDYPAFLESSSTAASLRRLNYRHRAIIESNVTFLRDANILDIASHDGRWSFAALRAGAKHVTGIEARPELVKRGTANMDLYGVERESYDFINGDIFATLSSSPPQVDVVLCLGFWYHTLRYPELLTGLRRTGTRWLVIDTNVLKARPRQPIIRMATNRTDTARESNAAPDPYGHEGRVLVGRPTPAALDLMLDRYGFESSGAYDWRSLLAGERGRSLADYRTGGRVTRVYRRQ